MEISEDFYGPNLGYVLELYDRYKRDPESVDPSTRSFFQQWTPPVDGAGHLITATRAEIAFEKIVSAVNLANAIRTYGHLAARLDPLGSSPPGDPWLDLNFHHITEDDLSILPAAIIGGPAGENSKNALEAIEFLRTVYSQMIGYDYGQLRVPEERDWIRNIAESGKFRPPQLPVDSFELLNRLTQVETLELFLHRIFPGKTRFSIEGLEMLVPLLDRLVESSIEAGNCTIMLGMAHRGRLNVLAHILNKPYAQILAEFKDPGGNFTTQNELGWTGDVKYHKGGVSALNGEDTVRLIMTMPPNPSHLEHINPVVMGMARSEGTVSNRNGQPEFFPDACLPILIHGDASFPAQGIVSESLNFSRLEGYAVGGTLHIVANNQLGYTTTPQEGRSTLHASDLAKGYEIPVVHVNADDPIACIEAALIAFSYRQRFHKDFVINMIGFRRHGHNEGDEPSFTQPLLYKEIEKHPGVRKKWTDRLVAEGKISPEEAEELVKDHMNHLHEVLESLQPEEQVFEPQLEPPPPGVARRVKTAVPLKRLRELNEALLKPPDGFSVHPKLQRSIRRRQDILNDPDIPSVDWATAEELALASILMDGIPIRLSGEDTARGTFNQRHAIFQDFEAGEKWIPLQTIPQAKAAFEVINSPLSELAALGYEYGYNIQSPGTLVIWEAQYGDFINAAQVIIDEFITSARPKWELTPSLVLWLPHGYEGQGPDHASARLERFLQLAAQINLRIANCTTASQFFHLLRRQAALLESDPLPLIVMTPKSLLRHPLVASPPRLLAEDVWHPVLDDERARQDQDRIRCLILCSGKISIDLITHELREENEATAIVRLEQLYRFPANELEEIFDSYPNLEAITWVQEEPKNMGAWTFVQPRLREIIRQRWPLRYVGRIENASPAEGSAAWHATNQAAIIKQAYQVEKDLVEGIGLVERE
jgi:2-oxoglutarate dehydrogenase E1 component